MKIQKKKNKITVNAETLPSNKEVSLSEKKIKMKNKTDDPSRVLSLVKKNKKKKKKKKNKNLSKIQNEKTDPQTNGVSQIESVDLDASEDVTPKEKKRSKSLENSVDKIDQTSAKKIKLDNKIDKSNQVQNKKNEAEPKNISFSVEELEEKIKAISSRENISKTARRNLAVLKKKLKVKQEFLASASVTSTVSGTEEEKLNAEKNPQTCDDKVKDVEKNELEEIDGGTQKSELEKKLIADKRKQKNRVKKSKNLNNDGENMKKESNCDDDEDDDGSSSKKKKKIDNVNTLSDSKDFDKETEDMKEKQNASKKKKNETRTTNFVKKEMDEIKNLTDAKGGKEENEVNSSIQKKEIKDTKKKIRYVLFIGNIPYSTCVDDIKNHFLTKVSKVISVRIPTAKQTHSPRGIAYVEFSNSTDYEKGLSLHHSILNGRRINVQYTQSGSKNAGKKSEIVSKNKKLHALRRQGKLAGSVKHTQKRNNKKNI